MPDVGGVLAHVARACVGVLHVVDGVVVGVPGEDVEVDVDVGVAGRPGQGIAAGIDPHRVDEVLEGDDRPRPLAHAQRLAVLDQVDHLPDEDLQVDPGGVTEGRAHRHHPADVAVVVGPQHDDDAVEPALALVEVVGEVAGDVGGLAGAADDDPVAVVAQVGRPQPDRAVLLVDPAETPEPLDRPLDGTGLVQVVLVEVDVEVDAELVEGLLDLVEHQVDALAPEDLLRLVVRQVEHVRDSPRRTCCAISSM